MGDMVLDSFSDKEGPRRLTEKEWQEVNAQRECRDFGHDWNVIMGNGKPIKLICSRGCKEPMYDVFPAGKASLIQDRGTW